jgi:hypothetical protein
MRGLFIVFKFKGFVQNHKRANSPHFTQKIEQWVRSANSIVLKNKDSNRIEDRHYRMGIACIQLQAQFPQILLQTEWDAR